jgi:hypothetical protein
MDKRLPHNNPHQWYIVFQDAVGYSTVKVKNREQARVLMKSLQNYCDKPDVNFSICQDKDIPSTQLWGPSKMILRTAYKTVPVEFWMRIKQENPDGSLELVPTTDEYERLTVTYETSRPSDNHPRDSRGLRL